MTNKTLEANVIMIELPPAFYDDHVDRALPAGTLVGANRNGYKIRCTEEELREIYSDAKHYADMGTNELGLEYLGLVTSARATVRRINKYRNAKG